MNDPLITIITVVLNDKAGIESTIKSVFDQVYRNIEYIIIDGGSKDGTLDILLKYENQLSVMISEPDHGIYDAMNKGTKLAKGDWLLYLNSGDQITDSYVLSNIFEKHKDILDNDIIYSDVIADYKTRKEIRKAKEINLFWRGLPFSHQAHLIKAIVAKSNPFKTNFYICADYDILYSLYKGKAKFYYVDLPIATVDATKGISKNVALSLLYSEFFSVSRKYSTACQNVATILIIPIELVYAWVRRILLKIS